jgi:uroporphyrinogen decarboxylase
MSELKNILKNKKICKSVWFMRQAGRYLPEFRKIRLENQNFIKLCLNSKLSSEITLQPIKRFNLDSAIIFSDILTVPYALGQKVNFVKDMGPKLNQFNFETFADNDKNSFTQELEPVYEAIRITRDKLNKEKSLIAFIGAPWTLLVYMLGMKHNKTQLDYEKIKLLSNKIRMILDKLIEYLFIHIENQINAGADVVQIFDSWAGLIKQEDFNNYCIKPNSKLVSLCKSKNIPVICFPRGIGENYKKFNDIVRPDGLNIDYEVDPKWARSNLKDVVIQGGLNPRFLLASEEEMVKNTREYLDAFKDLPYVFNLGHGLLPETDPDKVEKLIKFYRKY